MNAILLETTEEQAAETARLAPIKARAQRWAWRILEAAKNDARRIDRQGGKRSWLVQNTIEEIQLYFNGYAEPGYTDPECGIIATGNWNEITLWLHDRHYLPLWQGKHYTVSKLPSRIATLFEKLGIEIEWSDEWASCSDCNKLGRTQPDSYSWKPVLTLGEADLLCDDCKPEDEPEDEPDDETDEPEDEPED